MRIHALKETSSSNDSQKEVINIQYTQTAYTTERGITVISLLIILTGYLFTIKSSIPINRCTGQL